MRTDALIAEWRRFHLVTAAVRFGVPKALAGGADTAEALSAATGVPVDRLVRLLRGLIWAGVVRSCDEGLRLDESWRELLDEGSASASSDLMFHEAFFTRAWVELGAWLEHGVVPYEAAHGRSVFDRLAEEPELMRRYAQPMSTRTTEYAGAIADLDVFEGVGWLVDLGGGEGSLMVELLKRLPGVRGTVFDLPVMRESAESAIAAAGLVDRGEFLGGDLFDAVPRGADVYVLKWVLHDWDDDRAAAILSRCREAMEPHARLVVIERLMPEGWAESAALAPADLNMLCLSGGAERTQRGYRALIESCSMRLTDTQPIERRYGFWAMVCEPC